MRVAVIPADNIIAVDGDSRKPTGAVYPPAVHAIQWNGEIGHTEYLTGPQQAFTDASVIQPFIELHTAAKARDEAPAPMPTFEVLKGQILSKFRADRMQMFFVIASMISEAEINGDTVAVTALHVFRAGLKDLPAWPTVVAATDAAALTSAMSTQYKALVSALPGSQTLYFKELMG